MHSLTGLLHKDPKLPGAILSEPPRRITITPRGKEANLQEEMGVAISVPRNATVRDEHVDISTSFAGAYETPEGIASVSPAYTIETSREVKFNQSVEVRLAHTANLETAEEQKDVVVMKASCTPSQQGAASNAVHRFEEMEGTRLTFRPRCVVMKVKHFVSSIFKVGRRKKRRGSTEGTEGEWAGWGCCSAYNSRCGALEHAEGEKLYSARLYKAMIGLKVTAVFCICPEHPTYTNVSNFQSNTQAQSHLGYIPAL